MKTEKPSIDKYQRKAAFTNLKEFCIFAGDHDFIEVCQWKNGEGFSVELSGKLPQRFEMTYGEFLALKKLVKALDKSLDK